MKKRNELIEMSGDSKIIVAVYQSCKWLKDVSKIFEIQKSKTFKATFNM